MKGVAQGLTMFGIEGDGCDQGSVELFVDRKNDMDEIGNLLMMEGEDW